MQKEDAMKTEAYKLQQAKNKEVRAVIFIIILTFIVVFGGCSQPEVITKINYRTEYIPVMCNVTIPDKPIYDPSDLETPKELAVYYSAVEILLKGCVYGVDKYHR